MRPRSLNRMRLVLPLLLLVTAHGSARAQFKPPFSVQWIYSMGPDTRKPNAPLVQESRVYISHGGTLRCLDAITGAKLWEFTPKNGHVTTAPIAFQHLVIVGADNATIYAFNAADGKQAWDQLCAGPLGGDPIILGESLIFGAQEMVYAMVPATGQLQWVCALTAPVSEGPVTDGSMLYFLCQDGSLQSVDAVAGRYRWATPLRTGPNAFPPVMAERRVIVAGWEILIAVSRSGQVSWTAEMPVGIGGRPVLMGEALYVPTVAGEPLGGQGPRIVTQISPTQSVSGLGEIYLLHPRSGRAQRHAPLLVDGSATAPPLLREDVLYVGTGSSMVYALDHNTGAVLWVFRCLGADQPLDEASTYGIYAPMAMGGDALYVLTGAGDLYCFTPALSDHAGPVFSGMTPESSDALPGGRPVEVKFTVVDLGSGVDPVSIQATFDGAPVEVDFEPTSGEASFHVRSPKDAVHVIKVTAKDYRGNINSSQFSFLTDASIKPPPTERATEPRQRTTRRGAAGRGGGAVGGPGGLAY